LPDQDRFLTDARAVSRTGLATAGWIAVDDTGARHKGANGFRTKIGNDAFAWSATTGSKSRRNWTVLSTAFRR
jgi:hypothetical protein